MTLKLHNAEEACLAPSAPRRPLPAERCALMIYDGRYLGIKTVFHSLDCFARYSRIRFYFADARLPCLYDLNFFDAVIVHYSVRNCAGSFPNEYKKALQKYHGLKALFVQDEY